MSRRTSLTTRSAQSNIRSDPELVNPIPIPNPVTQPDVYLRYLAYLESREETKRVQEQEETKREQEETKRVQEQEETKRVQGQEETKRVQEQEETKRVQVQEKTKRIELGFSEDEKCGKLLSKFKLE